MEQANETRRRRREKGILPGVLVAGIGVLFLLNNLDIIYVEDWRPYWPVILILFGFVKLIENLQRPSSARWN